MKPDLANLVSTMAEKHMNSPLTAQQKALVMNRLNQMMLKTPDHPPYSAMIQKALVELSEKGGSSEESISKFLEKEYKDLPVAHLTFLRHHLAKLCESGDITLTRCKKYVGAGAKLSLEETVKCKETPVQRNFELNSERQQRKGTKQLVQQRKLSLKATVKINKRAVKRMFKWDYEKKQRRVKKLLAQQKNQKKNEKVKVTEKHSEPKEEAKESSQELLMAGQKTRAYQKSLKGRGLLSKALRRSKRLQNGFKQDKIEKTPDLSVELVLDEVSSGRRNVRHKAHIDKLPVKKIYKWDWERKQRQLKKLLAQKSNQMKNDESRVNEKHSERNDVQENGPIQDEENGSIQDETKEFPQELAMEGLTKRTYPKRLKGNGPISETLRRSKRLQNDFMEENEVEKTIDSSIELEELSEPKCIQMQPRRSKRLFGTKSENKLPCESERPLDQTVESDLSRIVELQEKVSENRDEKIESDSSQITELQQKEPENFDKFVEPDSSQITELQEKDPTNHMSDNQELVVKKCEEIKIYRRRSKAERQARLIVKDTKKEVEPRVSKSQTSSICIDIKDDQSLGSWIKGKRLWSRQQKSESKGVAKMDGQAANGSCSAMVVRTDEALETIDSVCNGTRRLREELPKIKRFGRPRKRPRNCEIIIALLANNSV